jgi:predicted CoA-binding protein
MHFMDKSNIKHQAQIAVVGATRARRKLKELGATRLVVRPEHLLPINPEQHPETLHALMLE